MTDERVERLARLLAEEFGDDPDEIRHAGSLGSLPLWRFYTVRARELLDVESPERRALARLDGEERG